MLSGGSRCLSLPVRDRSRSDCAALPPHPQRRRSPIRTSRSACWSGSRPAVPPMCRRASSASNCRAALGQPVVVENKTGAAGMIALNEMLAQPRDGHTLLLCSYIDPTNTHLFKKVAYKLEDLAPVSMVSKAFYAIVVPPDSPANNIKDFIALAKSKAGRAQLRQGRFGLGDRDHSEAAREAGRHQDDRRHLPRHRACDPGSGGGPHRVRGVAAVDRGAAVRREEGQDHRHDEPGAACPSRPMCRR